jgi:predicted transcriptional regulator
MSPNQPTPSDEGAANAPATALIDRIAAELDLLARNVDILEILANKRPMGIIRLSEALKLPIHKVRYSLHLLEREGVIQPSPEGAVVTDKAALFWQSLDSSLDQMSDHVRHLRERAAQHRSPTEPGRKGY